MERQGRTTKCGHRLPTWWTVLLEGLWIPSANPSHGGEKQGLVSRILVMRIEKLRYRTVCYPYNIATQLKTRDAVRMWRKGWQDGSPSKEGTSTHTHTHIHSHTHTHTTLIHTYIYTCTHIHTHAHSHTHTVSKQLLLRMNYWGKSLARLVCHVWWTLQSTNEGDGNQVQKEADQAHRTDLIWQRLSSQGWPIDLMQL